MTNQKSFKERIRARMDKTGESYVTARRRLIEKAEPRRAAAPQTIAPTRTNDDAVAKNTGRTWDEWFTLLDGWGAKERKHPEIARWLVDDHGVDGWWAQHVTVAYEQARGMRVPGQRADGTYGVSASKTVDAPVEVLFEAFEDEDVRARWLGDFDVTVRTARPAKSITAAWEDGSTRLSIGFTAKGDNKSQVALAHERITDPRKADEMKAFWRDSLNTLKKLLES